MSHHEYDMDALGRCRDCDRVFPISLDIETEAPLTEIRITAACPGCGAVADMNIHPPMENT